MCAAVICVCVCVCVSVCVCVCVCVCVSIPQKGPITIAVLHTHYKAVCKCANINPGPIKHALK